MWILGSSDADRVAMCHAFFSLVASRPGIGQARALPFVARGQTMLFGELVVDSSPDGRLTVGHQPDSSEGHLPERWPCYAGIHYSRCRLRSSVEVQEEGHPLGMPTSFTGAPEDNWKMTKTSYPDHRLL